MDDETGTCIARLRKETRDLRNMIKDEHDVLENHKEQMGSILEKQGKVNDTTENLLKVIHQEMTDRLAYEKTINQTAIESLVSKIEGIDNSLNATIDKVGEIDKMTVIQKDINQAFQTQINNIDKLIRNVEAIFNNKINELERSLKTKGEDIESLTKNQIELIVDVSRLKRGGHSGAFPEGH